jgi:hypothetical protein
VNSRIYQVNSQVPKIAMLLGGLPVPYGTWDGRMTRRHLTRPRANPVVGSGFWGNKIDITV